MTKVLEAHWVWRQYPRQIASDLSQYHHRHIKEWHDGTMSSYELLELLEFMPERGSFKSAARGAEYSEEEKFLAQIANELMVLRSAYVPGVKAEEYGSTIFLSPAKIKDLIAQESRQTEVRDDFYSFASRAGVRFPDSPEDDGDDDDDD